MMYTKKRYEKEKKKKMIRIKKLIFKKIYILFSFKLYYI